MKRLALALAAAALALAACAEDAPATKTAASVQAADIDAASPLDAPYRLKNAEAVDIDALFSLFPAYLKPKFESAEFDKKIGATVVRNLAFGAEGERDAFHVERAEFYGVSAANIDLVRAANDAPLDAPMERIFDKVRFFGVTRDDGSAAISAVEIDALRVRQGGLPRGGSASGLAALFNAFDVAGVYFKDVAFASDEAEKDNVESGFKAADLRFVGVGAGEISAIIARDLDFSVAQSSEALRRASGELGPLGGLLRGPLGGFLAPASQRVKAKSFEWRNVTFEGLMEYGLKGERPPADARNLINLGAIRMTEVESFIEDRRFSVIPEALVTAMEFEWIAPSKVRAVTHGGVYDFTAYVSADEKEARAALKSRKLDRVKGDSDFAYDWSAEKGVAVMSTGFDSAGFADFDFDATIEGLKLADIEKARAAGVRQPVAELARLRSLQMRLDDETMLDAFYALSALESGGDADDMRAAAPALLRLGKKEFARDNPISAGFVDAIADFLEKGGALEMRAAPATPAPLGSFTQIRSPDAAAEALGLTIVREE